MGIGDGVMQLIVRKKYLDELIELYVTPDIKVIIKWRKLHSLLWSFRHFLYCIMRIENI